MYIPCVDELCSKICVSLIRQSARLQLGRIIRLNTGFITTRVVRLRRISRLRWISINSATIALPIYLPFFHSFLSGIIKSAIVITGVYNFPATVINC